MYDAPANWKLRFVVFGAIAIVAGALYYRPITDALAARSFPVETLRELEQLVSEFPRDPNTGRIPPRTGRVLVIRPSVQFVYSGSLGDPRSWTTIRPAERRAIGKEIDPPAVHPAWFELDSSLRAGSPEEIDTVVFCDMQSIRVGTYVPVDGPGSAMAANRRDAVLTAYDRRTRKFLGSYVIFGAAPPNETTLLGKHTGAAPNIAGVLQLMELSE